MAERFQHVLRFVREAPWAILPQALDEIMDILKLRASGGRLTDEEILARIGPEAATRPTSRAVGTVQVIPVFGVMAQRMNMLTNVSGGTSTELVGQAIKSAIADPQVSALVLDVDSPGGSVFGVEMLADTIQGAKGEKPIVAVANSLAASAAYWVASQADEFVVVPGAQVGSIGVIGVHEDLTGMAEKAGVKVTYVSAGRLKTQGQEFEPLSDEGLGRLKATVDAYYNVFVKAVARGRGVSQKAVREGFGEGAVVPAEEALALGMVDRIDTLDGTIARLTKKVARTAGARAEVVEGGIEAAVSREIRRRRLQLAERS